MNAVRWLALVLIVAAVFWARIVPRVFHESGLVSTSEIASTANVDEAQALITRFGKPDADTLEPVPVGALPTRALMYRDLRIVFVQREAPGGRTWKLVGFMDPKTRESLSGDEALRRLLGRT